jgi:outer membrane protein OmpA-like peptidoglycan-associated protein
MGFPRMLRLRTLALLLIAALSWSNRVAAQDDEEAPPPVVTEEVTRQDAPPPATGDEPLHHWWLGAYFRHLEVPGFILDAFLEKAPEISNNGFGLVGTYRTGEGLNIEIGVGYMPLEFEGPLLAPGNPDTDTELATSDLGFFHLTGSVLWDIEFHSTVALEIGVGLDLGLLSGDVVRNEAYLDGGEYRPCAGPGNPGTRLNPLDPTSPLYCNTEMVTTDPGDEGEHYNVKEDAIPPFFAVPMLPRVGLRIQPFKYLAIKAEAAFGIYAWWVGVSLHGSFGMLAKNPERVFERAEEVGANGRVLGRVVEAGTDVPVAGATVTQKARALSPLQTMNDGRFIVDRLDAGEIRFEIERDGYLPGHCEATIPKKGGDVHLVCQVAAMARLGALSGLVKTENGKPIGGASVEIDGPKTTRVSSSDDGSFGAVDLPEGTYRMRVDAEGFLMQMLEIEIEAQDTVMPKVILIKKPKRSLVTLSNKEIVISQQVRFETNSAEIVASSDPLLREIADVFLRNPHVQLVEIQGHTDNTGGAERNKVLSQERAEAVKAWLVNAGVAEGRLEAKGYGPDHPLTPNKTAADRAKNRRVQLIIRKQSAEVSEEPEEE